MEQNDTMENSSTNCSNNTNRRESSGGGGTGANNLSSSSSLMPPTNLRRQSLANVLLSKARKSSAPEPSDDTRIDIPHFAIPKDKINKVKVRKYFFLLLLL